MTDDRAHAASERASGADPDEVLDELVRREPLFHYPEPGTTRADFEALTAGDFWEVGASGRCYSREFVWSVLKERMGEPGDDPWESSEFLCRALSADTYLLTYVLRQGERLTRRATIWQTTGGCWKIIYHQGTVVSDGS